MESKISTACYREQQGNYDCQIAIKNRLYMLLSCKGIDNMIFHTLRKQRGYITFSFLLSY